LRGGIGDTEMNNLRIKDMAKSEKPIEKMIEHGAEILSDAELLAIILRSGTSEMSVLNLSQLILNSHPVHKGLSGLNYRHINDLTEIPGVGKVKACQIIALTEISRRMSSEVFKDKICFESSETVADYFMEQLKYLTRERVYAVFTSTSGEMIYKIKLSEGSINRSIMSASELFKEALKVNATGIILVHNHPSGDPSPSEMDIQISQKIKKLGQELGIPLIDHVIIGKGTYFSLAGKGLI
jgi:DNA repair protein RadC